MKTAALFLLFLAASATGMPTEDAIPTGSTYGDMINNGINSIYNYATWLYGSAKTKMDEAGVTGAVNSAAAKLNQAFQSAVEKGTVMTSNALGNLVTNSMQSAITNNLIPQDVADSILATFHLPGASEAPELILTEIQKLHLGGNQMAAGKYKKNLKELFEAQISKEASALTILACLEYDLLELLGSNGIIQSRASELFNYYYQFIVDAFRNPEPVVQSVTEFINNLKPKLIKIAKGAQEYVANFQISTSAIQEKLSAAGDLTVSALQNGLVKLLNQAVTKNIIKSQEEADRMAASFGVQNGATAFTSEEIGSLELGGDKDTALSLRLTLQSAVEKVENGGVSIVVLLSANGAVLSALAGNGALPGAALLAGAKGYVATAF